VEQQSYYQPEGNQQANGINQEVEKLSPKTKRNESNYSFGLDPGPLTRGNSLIPSLNLLAGDMPSIRKYERK